MGILFPLKKRLTLMCVWLDGGEGAGGAGGGRDRKENIKITNAAVMLISYLISRFKLVGWLFWI